MEKEFYLKVKFPDGKELDSLDLEQLIYFSIKNRLESEINGLLEFEDFKTLDVTCTRTSVSKID